MNQKIIYLSLISLIGIVVFLNVSIITTDVGTSMNIDKLCNINIAMASETSDGYEMQSQTTETQEKIENGLHCVRTRTKIECIGTGSVNCTPTDWTDWSIWTCG